MTDPTDNEEGLQADKTKRIVTLLTAYICQQLSPKGQEELDAWIAASDDNMLLFEELTDRNNLLRDVDWMAGIAPQREVKKIKTQLKFSKTFGSFFNFLKKWWHYALIAITITIGLALLSYKTPGRPLHPLQLIHKQNIIPEKE